jgi:hypothetical protein
MTRLDRQSQQKQSHSKFKPLEKRRMKSRLFNSPQRRGERRGVGKGAGEKGEKRFLRNEPMSLFGTSSIRVFVPWRQRNQMKEENYETNPIPCCRFLYISARNKWGIDGHRPPLQVLTKRSHRSARRFDVRVQYLELGENYQTNPCARRAGSNVSVQGSK